MPKGGYLAFQAKAPLARQFAGEFALVLTRIAKANNLGIVFFCAGTAPGHDSKGAYGAIRERMPAEVKSHILQAENVFSNVALISRAAAVLASSLHARIMAFIHSRPRILISIDHPPERVGAMAAHRGHSLTSCPKKTKHSAFIRLWDRWEGASDLGRNRSVGTLAPKCTGDLADDTSAAIAMHESIAPELQSRVKACQHWYLKNFDAMVSMLNH